MAAEHDIETGIPALERRVAPGGVVVWTDHRLSLTGVLIAFSERMGGVSEPPYDSLNLAAHVSDEPEDVDANRTLLLEALGIGGALERLITAEQVHGDRIAVVGPRDAGAGAFARGKPRIPATDALVTSTSGLPLLMLYADCVPVILVAPPPHPAVCVVHAGWRGALSGLPGSAAIALARHAERDESELIAYVGPHIGGCCYEVGDEILSHFCNTFDTIGPVDGLLDLGAAVRESLTLAGVTRTRIAAVESCTLDHTDRFFSYRAAPVTGRHGALAMITEGEYDEPASEAE
jgi:YfiH family protein